MLAIFFLTAQPNKCAGAWDGLVTPVRISSNPHKNLRVATYTPVTSVLRERTGTGGSLGLAGCQSSSKFRERQTLSIRWSAIEQATHVIWLWHE